MSNNAPQNPIEFKHATHSIHNGTDYICLRYNEHLPNGEVIPKLQHLIDWQRPVWVVKPEFRTYKDKRTYEPTHRLKKIMASEAAIPRALAVEFNRMYARDNTLYKYRASPHVYGLAPTTTSLLKHKIKSKFPETLHPNRVCVGDIETNMLSTDENIICMSITMKEKVYCVILKSFVNSVSSPLQKLNEAANDYMGELIEDRNLKIKFELADTSAEVVIKILTMLHSWKPDFFAFWNINFDMPRCIKALEDEGYDPKDYFCDPSVPKEYRYFKYYEQQVEATSSGGRAKNIAPSELWHKLTAHAYWYAIDPMCFFRKNRKHLKQEVSYALDYLGKKYVKMGKLRFKEADHIQESSSQWHVFMQKNYPIEYCIYNIQDCILVEMFDEYTNDLATTVQLSAGDAEYTTMFNIPTALEHDFYFELLEKDLVLGQAGGNMTHELDKYLPSGDGIIVMLPSHLITDNGVRIFADAKGIVTQLRVGASDADVTAAYPTSQELMNLERETITRELTEIEGLTSNEVREVGFMIANGIVNSVQICNVLYKVPRLIELQDIYERRNNVAS